MKRIELMEGFDIKVLQVKLPAEQSPFIEKLSTLYNKSQITIAQRLQFYLQEEISKIYLIIIRKQTQDVVKDVVCFPINKIILKIY